MDNSVLQISSETAGFIGSCFAIDRDENGIFVATCGHVINNRSDQLLVDGKGFEVINNTSDTGLDLAILYVKGLDCKPFNIVSNTMAKHAKVIGYTTLIGNPKREAIDNISIKHNIVLSTPSKIDLMKLFTKEAILQGYSGSPVICKMSGDVIGIVNIREGKSTNYAISSKHLLDIYNINDNGLKDQILKTNIKPYYGLTTKINKEDFSNLKRHFEKNFEKSLESYSGQPKIWIKPRIHTEPEEAVTVKENNIKSKVDINEIINKPESLIIKARQQYGLTTLSHYLVKEAWMHSQPSLWLRLDANELKPHTSEINKYVLEKLDELKLENDDIKCIILDELSGSVVDANKIFHKLNDLFSDKPIIVMYTDMENPFLNESISLPETKKFHISYLWALPRNDIRQVVVDYNNAKYIGNENDVVTKIVSDLEVLNIPRTALNCLTILKISEMGFDDSPVNRTDMLGRILSLLFNVDNIPRYKTRPDLKDTEHTLGYFCELMLEEEIYYFSRKDFLSKLNDFCEHMEIELDIDIIFDVLFSNNIIVLRNDGFCFKFTYWIFYFAAHRMHKNKEFADYIFKDMNYTAYPELIEFYTGIDRSRDNALEILMNDLKDTCDIVEKKCGLPSDFNIYDIAQWNPSEERIEQMHEEVSEGVLESKLPDIIKDEYADKSYNRSRSLNQNIHKILEDYSLLRLMKGVKASSKALRNSDYASPEIKHKLLKQILRSWKQITNVLIALSPILSEQGEVTVDGASFALDGDFGKTAEERFNQVIPLFPINVVSWFKDDLFSKKMSKLLYNHMKHEEHNLIKHELNLLIINKRPNGWDKHIENYIISQNKNSFYLNDVYGLLKAEYKYSFASEGNLRIIKKLIKMSVIKHELGMKKPTPSAIKSFEKKCKITIPTRDKDID